MKSVAPELPPQIPSCKIRGRLMPACDFLPRLKKLCLSLGFNNPSIVRSDKLASSEVHLADDGHDRIVILSTMISYEQNWGGYSGLPGQHCREKSCDGPNETPSDFILPFLHQYRFAQSHIHLGRDSTGRCVVMLPDFLVQGREDGESGLRVMIEKIAEPNANGQIEPLVASGSLLTFAVSARFCQALGNGIFPVKPGVFTPIGEYLVPELFRFVGAAEPVHRFSPFSTILLPKMPWIVTHKTPHLAATLLHLQTIFLREADAFAATGPEDLRNLLCVAGLDIDMSGFRGRKERYFVPWQACWKRHGYCYGNIYPLLQDDLIVALMNYNRMGSGAENCGEFS